MSKAATSKVPTAKHRWIIDFSQPAKDDVVDGSQLEKFLRERIKVEGKAGQLGDKVKIVREGNTRIIIISNIPSSKRYLKYLIKKFLKKYGFRDWIRVVAPSKDSYELRFYNVAGAGDEEEEE